MSRRCWPRVAIRRSLGADNTIKLKPETSVLGLQVGDEITLTASDFTRLADAYFDEMDVRFGAKA
ncbi:hypothetical protein BH683_020250 [Williamsia sp. 1138]|jgi:hypothetical protein|uniref:AbrB/MazE/SpoVT family DNA-binding domain-containing protein n=1 Tax=Gordonia rubripertincta TaxID=36822 RepID=A0ABT4MV36_GORRU|nr:MULTISPECIES: hypothetical protein [Mycobacteriales]MCZ4550874.1 hypothetical protein [Gordonia rubripertincta]OZG27239.1 hypothetical protein BH683_020250 [Williamsia sp. 1138]